MTTTIYNKLEKIGKYLIVELLLHYVQNNEGCDWKTKRRELPFMMKEAAKYYMENTEEFYQVLNILFTNETTNKMCEEFLNEEEEFDKCVKEFFKCLGKIFSLLIK